MAEKIVRKVGVGGNSALLVPNFQMLFEAVPIAMMALQPDGEDFIVIAVSMAYADLVRKSREELLGLPLTRCLPDQLNHTEQISTILSHLRDSFLSRQASEFTSTGWRVQTKVVKDANGNAEYLLQSICESGPLISSETRSHEPGSNYGNSWLDSLLLQIDSCTRHLAAPDEVVACLARLLIDNVDVDGCAFWAFTGDNQTLEMTQDYTRSGLPGLAANLDVESLSSYFRGTVLAGQTAIEEDTEAKLRSAADRAELRKACIRSLIAVPLYKGNRVVSAMLLYSRHPKRWSAEGVERVRLAAHRCWELIERAHFENELETSERRLRLSQRAGHVGSFEWLIRENKVIWTAETEALYGLPEGSFEGTLQDWQKRVVDADAQAVIAQVQSCIANHQIDCSYEFRAILPDGRYRWLRGQAQFIYDKDGVVARMLGVNIDIDAQREAEDYLHRQWRSFDTALSNSPDLTYTFDAEGRFTYANRSLVATLGKPLEEICGKNFYDLDYPPELADKLAAQIQEVVRTRQPVRDQTPFTSAAGETRHYEYIFVPVVSASGRVEAIAGSTRDVTERKKTEDLLEEDRRRWRDLLSQAPAAIAVLHGPEHTFQWLNGEGLALFRKPAESVIGKKLVEVLPSSVGERYVELVNRVYQSGRPYSAHEAHIVLGEPDTAESFLNFVCLPIRDGGGQIDGTFIHATDVTALVRARHQVEASEELFRKVIDSMPQLVWSTRPDGYHDLYNKKWYEYTGLSLDETKGEQWESVFHPDDRAIAWARWRHSLQTGQPYQVEYRCRRFDGQYRWFLGRAVPIYNDQRQIARWFGTCTDIHDQKENEAALRKANRELEEFSYVASHDLQEPLRMVNIYTQLILKRLPQTDERILQYAGFVQKGVTRMESLIEDLLAYSRVVHADEPVASSTNLGDALTDALSVLKSRIEHELAQITYSPLPTVVGDASQLSQVFQNLLSNALKYSRVGVPAQINITARQQNRDWIVAVADNGIGFEPEYAQRIFGLFKRLHKDAYPGTGLGLAICKRVIERHGGKIWAEGTPGEGSTFFFSLPVLQAVSPAGD